MSDTEAVPVTVQPIVSPTGKAILPQWMVRAMFPVVVAAGALGFLPSSLAEQGIVLPSATWLTIVFAVAKGIYLLGAAFGIVSQGARAPAPPPQQVVSVSVAPLP